MADPSYDAQQASLYAAGVGSSGVGLAVDAGQIQIKPQGPQPVSVSTGGGINIDNTNSTGAGVVLFSNRGADAGGRLLVLKAANALYGQAILRIENAGSNAGISLLHTGTNNTVVSPVDLTSTDRTTSLLGVKGVDS